MLKREDKEFSPDEKEASLVHSVQGASMLRIKRSLYSRSRGTVYRESSKKSFQRERAVGTETVFDTQTPVSERRRATDSLV